jgi:hypothetical protein
MKHTAPRFLWIVAACLALPPAPESASKPDSSKPIAPAPPAARTKDWPREFKEDGSTLVLYDMPFTERITSPTLTNQQTQFRRKGTAIV